MLWQRDLCESLGLKGRILISEHGINGTVGGDMEACKKYVRKTREYPGFKKMAFKWSDGDAEDFPRLSVKVRDEIVAFGAPGELKVDEDGDGKYDLTYKATENSRGELVDYTYIIYIAIGAAAVVIILIVTIIIKKRLKLKKS